MQVKQNLDVNNEGNLTGEKRSRYFNVLLQEIEPILPLEIGGKRSELLLDPITTQPDIFPQARQFRNYASAYCYTIALDSSRAFIAIRYRDDTYRERHSGREIVPTPLYGVAITQS